MEFLTDIPPAAWRRLGPLLIALILLALVVAIWLIVTVVTLPHRWRHRNDIPSRDGPIVADWAEIVERDRIKQRHEQAARAGDPPRHAHEQGHNENRGGQCALPWCMSITEPADYRIVASRRSGPETSSMAAISCRMNISADSGTVSPIALAPEGPAVTWTSLAITPSGSSPAGKPVTRAPA